MDAIVVFFVGAAHIGKTALITALTQNKSFDIGPTLGIELRTWSYKHMDNIYRFRIWDVSGRSIFSDIVSMDIQHGDVSIICYDTCDMLTLNTMKEWLTVVEQSPKKQHVILCGFIKDGEEREVMPSEVYSICEHAKRRGNFKTINVVETRHYQRQPLFQALVGAVVLPHGL